MSSRGLAVAALKGKPDELGHSTDVPDLSQTDLSRRIASEYDRRRCAACGATAGSSDVASTRRGPRRRVPHAHQRRVDGDLPRNRRLLCSRAGTARGRQRWPRTERIWSRRRRRQSAPGIWSRRRRRRFEPDWLPFPRTSTRPHTRYLTRKRQHLPPARLRFSGCALAGRIWGGGSAGTRQARCRRSER